MVTTSLVIKQRCRQKKLAVSVGDINRRQLQNIKDFFQIIWLLKYHWFALVDDLKAKRESSGVQNIPVVTGGTLCCAGV